MFFSFLRFLKVSVFAFSKQEFAISLIKRWEVLNGKNSNILTNRR
jgi:hypothetical protein